jgi:Tol biopolymer transport system component
VTIGEQERDIWLYNFSRDTLTRLTFGGSENAYPIWTPDAKRITFMSNRDGPSSQYWQLADGSGGLERLNACEYTQVAQSWSPDGQLLAFIEISPTTGYDIWVLRMSDRKAQPFLRTPFNESAAQFSPDGHWLAYRAALKFTSNPIRARSESGKFRQRVARSQCGIGMDGNCFTAVAAR